MMSTVTISDVAREAGVSKQTVSRALNARGEISGETRQRILEIAQRLGYHPSSIARGLATQRTYQIGVTVPEIIHPFYAELVTSMQHTAWEAGYLLFQIATANDPQRERAALASLEAQRVDGIISCRSQLPDDEIMSGLRRFSAAVAVPNSLPDASIGQIDHDSDFAMQLAVNHLHAVGCQNLAMLVGRLDSHYGRRRVNSFVAALRAAGVDEEPHILQEHMLNMIYNWPEDWMRTGLESDLATVALLAAHPDIDGLVCYNDIYAIGAIRALQRIGRRVPQDVAVIGVDDILLARIMSPSLTTLDARTAEIGARAVHMIVDKLNGCGTMESVCIQHRLVVRESTARPSGAPPVIDPA